MEMKDPDIENSILQASSEKLKPLLKVKMKQKKKTKTHQHFGGGEMSQNVLFDFRQQEQQEAVDNVSQHPHHYVHCSKCQTVNLM